MWRSAVQLREGLLLLLRGRPLKLPRPFRLSVFAAANTRPGRSLDSEVVSLRTTFASTYYLLGGIAQLVERLLCKQEVRSSNLLISTSRAIASAVALFVSIRRCFLGALPLKYPAALCPLCLRFAQTGTGGSPAGSFNEGGSPSSTPLSAFGLRSPSSRCPAIRFPSRPV